MILLTNYLLFIMGLLVTLGSQSNAKVAPSRKLDFSCGLRDFEPNWSYNPHVLPPISDKAENGERVWETAIFGPVKSTLPYSQPHAGYLDGAFSIDSMTYWFVANSKTKNFVQEQGTRDMVRRILITCQDESTPRYSFQIPVHELSPPKFMKDEYICNVSNDWNRQYPISRGQFVIVSVNSTGDPGRYDNKTLRYISTPDILEVDAHPLWVFPDPPQYYFRLDIFLKEHVKLPHGKNEALLSAIDGFNGGTAKININVSS